MNKDKDKDKEAEKKKEEKPAATPEKSPDPPKSGASGSKGCSLTNNVRFAKGASAQTFKCELDTNTGNTKHRYVLDAQAGQDLTITFKSTDACYVVTEPNSGGRTTCFNSYREQIPLTKDGKWIVGVELVPGATFGDYTINFEIR